MSDNPTKHAHDLKELADEVLESIDEDPEMEPGQADKTPAVNDAANKGRSPVAQKPQKT